MRVFKLRLSKGFEYNVDVENDGEVKVSVTFPLEYIFNAEKLRFADKLAMALMKGKLE